MNTELGMYARTDFGITKLKHEEDIELLKEDIKKTSYNIIDLIEVGDYVNGCIVTKTANSFSGIYIEINYGWERKSLDNRDIKSVLTHEQFECMEWKIDEGEEK